MTTGERRFPLQDGPSIAWEIISPHERQAQHNHNQTLERLAQRGGLSCAEFWHIMNDAEWGTVISNAEAKKSGHDLACQLALPVFDLAQRHAVDMACLTWKRMADCVEEFGDFPEACGEFIEAHYTACLKLIEVFGGIDAIRVREREYDKP